jgi:hypothetical protein
MDTNNLPGLTPLWLILLATVLATLIPIAVPFVFGADVKASDWTGFAGSVLTAGVAGIAIYYGWRGIVRQLRVSLMSREEDRMERELPGLQQVAALLGRANILCLMEPLPMTAIRVLKSLGLQTSDGSVLNKLETKLPRASDADRRALTAILEKIDLSAINATSLQQSLEPPLSEDESQLMSRQMVDMTDAIRELASFKASIDEKIATFQRRIPQFKAELSRFFEG